MVETQAVKPGDVGTLDAELPARENDLTELQHYWERMIRRAPGIQIVDFYRPSVRTINGMQALCISYTRTVGRNPPALVQTYIFDNYDRTHSLTMSYRVTEEEKWNQYFPAILASFRITAIRELQGSAAPEAAPDVREKPRNIYQSEGIATAAAAKQANAYLHEGLAHYAAGRNTEAIAAYKKAIKLKPDYPEAYLYMGYAYEQIKQYTDAIAAYRQYLRLKPTGSMAEYARKAIRRLRGY